MKIILLTHERELLKASNTGRLVKASLEAMVEIVIWRRKEPDLCLLSVIDAGKAALLFPQTDREDGPKSSISAFDTFVILDSTWQQARKMYNQSSYLKKMPKVSLDAAPDSRYQLRRNQLEGGLCTAECVIELLKQTQQYSHAKKLHEEFDLMNSAD